MACGGYALAIINHGAADPAFWGDTYFMGWRFILSGYGDGDVIGG